MTIASTRTEVRGSPPSIWRRWLRSIAGSVLLAVVVLTAEAQAMSPRQSERVTTGLEASQEEIRFLMSAGGVSLAFILLIVLISKLKEARYRQFDSDETNQVQSMQQAEEIAIESLGAAQARSQQGSGDSTTTFEPLRGPYPWGGTFFPRNMLGTHFALLGAPGSGKTVSMRLLLGAVLRDNPSPRILMFDPKGDEVWPMLRGIGVEPDRIITMNPFDKRAWAWDLAEDFKTPAQAAQLSAMLVPEDSSASTPYFWQTARLIVVEVIKVFQAAEANKLAVCARVLDALRAHRAESSPVSRAGHRARIIETLGDAWTEEAETALLACDSDARAREVLADVLHTDSPWSLNDVIEATSSVERLKLVLGATHDGQECRATHLENQGKKTSGAVLSTLASKLQRFTPIARVWARIARERHFSVSQWLRGNCVLVVAIDEEHEEVMQALNELLFRRVADQVVRLPERRVGGDEHRKPETWFFLDELRAIGKLDKLPNVLNKGRSKGARVVIGFQDIHGLIAVYKENVTKEILATCENFGFLALTSPESRAWASEFFSSYYQTVTSRSQTGGFGTTTFSTSEQVQLMPAIPANAFVNLPQATPEGGVHGFFYIRSMKPWRGHIRQVWRDAWLDQFDDAEVGFDPQSAELQNRLPWPRNTVAEHLHLDILPPDFTAPSTDSVADDPTVLSGGYGPGEGQP